jgi:FlaA1/EpsC-like NDP-sugar epimerase
MLLDNKRVVITGGTGSLGKVLIRRLLSGEIGTASKIVVLSRDEAKQHQMRVEYMKRQSVTDEVIYRNFQQLLEFRIGDVRDFHCVASVLRGADIVFNAAALKQVPVCEYFPYEAVQTNIAGPENISRAIREFNLPVQTVVGISTDKACKPVNVMGMTKAIQERVFIRANLECPETRFICVRYGNVLASRGSVIPLFLEQISHGGPVTITTADMTRFLLSLNDAVDIIFEALRSAKRGETYIPRVPSAKVTDIADVIIAGRPIKTVITGIRPGEKVHEILVSEEECHRTYARDRYYAIAPILPELRADNSGAAALKSEYSSADNTLSFAGVRDLLDRHKLLGLDSIPLDGELLR